MTSQISAPAERRSRLVTFFVLAAFLLVAALPAMAATVNVFGPRTFVRVEGKPNTIKTSFNLPAGVTQCQLSITGAEDGPLAANNVSVKVNGVEMLDTKKVTVSQQPAALLAENSLVVTLKGKPGDAVTVTITGEVQDAPPAPPTPPTPPTPPMPPTLPMPPMLPAE